MELTTYEKIMLWIIAITEKVKEYFLKFYPKLALGFSILFTYGIVGGLDRNRITANDFHNIICVAVGLTILTLIYFIVLLLSKLKGE